MNAVSAKNQDLVLTSGVLWLDVLSIGFAAAGNALLAARVQAAPLAVGLVLMALAVRLIQLRSRILTVPLHLPFLLFLLTAWIGVTVSFDPALSLRKFELIIGGICLYYVLATTQTNPARRAVVWGVLAIGAGVAVFFVTQTDFSREPLKIGALNQMGLWLNRVTLQLGQHTPHANLMAGIMLLALPYAAGLAYNALARKQILTAIASGGLGSVIAFGLVMTTSRGALLALVLFVGIGIILLVAGRLAARAGYSAGVGVAAVINLGLILFLIGFIFARNQIGGSLNDLFGNVNSVPRLELYNQVTQLARDYAFTGAGLDTFSPQYSTYELLIDVPFLPHAHNLFLQVWLEQGILGLGAFIWLIAGYSIWIVRRRGRMNWLALASAAAFSMMLLHGMVDVLFYFSRVISLMFIPLGLAVCALEPLVPLEQTVARPTRRIWMAGAVAAGIALILVVGLVITQRRAILAGWAANQGALKQAQIELPLVDVPAPTAHQIRHDADLTEAEQWFAIALQADPDNSTAHARLGLIALDRFDFLRALGHLEAGYSAEPSKRPLIKALGYAYVWTDQPDKAAPLLKKIPEAEAELSYAAFEWRGRNRNDLSDYALKMIQQLKR